MLELKWLLLQTQVVRDEENRCHYFVVTGAGMGLPMAGDVADAFLLDRA